MQFIYPSLRKPWSNVMFNALHDVENKEWIFFSLLFIAIILFKSINKII